MHYGHLPLREALTLAAFRTQSGWEVCVEEDQLWVRADAPSAEVWRLLPFAGRFTKAPDGSDRLIRVGQNVPVRRVPEGPWQLLVAWMPVPRPASIPGGVAPPPVDVKPVRLTREERPVALLLLTRAVWEAWAITAPEVRLAPLQFALASDGRVCVRGQPLPPLLGEAWSLEENIALPAGFGLPSFCTAAWLSERLDVPENGIALWHEDGGAEVLPGTAFLPATRANVRASAQALACPPS